MLLAFDHLTICTIDTGDKVVLELSIRSFSLYSFRCFCQEPALSGRAVQQLPACS